MDQELKNTLIKTAVYTGAAYVVTKIAFMHQDRQHAKRMKMLAENRKRIDEMNAWAVATADRLEKQLETAKFWDIVTRSEE